MTDLSRASGPAATAPTDPVPVYLDARAEFAARYLFGTGLEIGPLHQPLAMPPHARARYVDRMQVDDLRREYPELVDWDLTPVDVIDDGETLSTVAAESQDFIVANHFLEHCEDPIGTIETHLGKLKPGGVLFYAVPDKRYTFDFRRRATALEHMVADYDEGPEGSRRAHYDEWARLVLVEEGESEQDQLAKARRLEEEKYSIHMHVWTQAEFLALILACRERLGEAFDLEAAARQGLEFVVVLRKRGALPEPPQPAQARRPGLLPRLGAKLRRTGRRLRTAK
ncbi:MAG TPA: methyltransferase domain-containing protein [Solirubrobacterales bacterium]|nr:methyltransferase domain-containing protein [Solirubrobacterales bacterium]